MTDKKTLKSRVMECLANSYVGWTGNEGLESAEIEVDRELTELCLTFKSLYFHELAAIITTFGLEDVLILGMRPEGVKHRTDVLIQGRINPEHPVLKE